jgi:ribonucleoside-diphosphate reductase alpha chain
MKKADIEYIKARNGEIRAFDPDRIKNAIEKAAYTVKNDKAIAANIAGTMTDKVCSNLSKYSKNGIVDLEEVQDMIESLLMSQGHLEIAKSFILYRQNRNDIRLTKSVIGIKDDLKLSVNAAEVLRQRYLLKNSDRNTIETPHELFHRVASHVAKAEKIFPSGSKRVEVVENEFFRMLSELEFLPNSPTLMNAGTTLGQLAACFVLPVGDSIDQIFRSLHDMAIIHQTGGGTGFDFSELRPKGDLVSSTQGQASGPVSFISIFDHATDVIVQGGKRRGANMGILRCDHPDIVEFIQSKSKGKDRLTNFNISVGITDKFINDFKKNRVFELINPRTKRTVNRIKARVLFDLIVTSAWDSGDPGLIFLDEINRKNPLIGLGRITATNPCGELPLFPYECCNLASLNLSKFVSEGRVLWPKLKRSVQFAVRFLDDVIEINKYPLDEIRKTATQNRKIGLGIMGFADMLIKMGLPYNSPEAYKLGRKVMRFIRKCSVYSSIMLAQERGVFPNYKNSIYAKSNQKLRNSTLNSIAPTGTISIIADCSSGIEPLFAISYVRNVLAGTRLFELNHLFKEAAERKKFGTKDVFARIAQEGSLKNIKNIPKEVRKLFVTAHDIKPADHLKMQAVFQKYTDNAVSKTVNLSETATPEDIQKIFISAYEMKCKGITIYRYGSKDEQVLSFKEAGEDTGPGFDGNKSFNGGEVSSRCVHGSCIY